MLIHIGLALGLLALGMGISEYYHRRIDRARRELVPMDQPDLWDLTPAPQPSNLIAYAHKKRAER